MPQNKWKLVDILKKKPSIDRLTVRYGRVVCVRLYGLRGSYLPGSVSGGHARHTSPDVKTGGWFVAGIM